MHIEEGDVWVDNKNVARKRTVMDGCRSED